MNINTSLKFHVKRVKSAEDIHEFHVTLSDPSGLLPKRGHSIRSGLTGLKGLINVFLSRKYQFSEQDLRHAEKMKTFVDTIEDDLDLTMSMYDTIPR